jgi:murein DD-endopeptidase MepM/ murein hydrolase activator NlpD
MYNTNMLYVSKLLKSKFHWSHSIIILIALVIGFSFSSTQAIQPKSLNLNDPYEFKVNGEVLFVFQNVAEVNEILYDYKMGFLSQVDPNARILSMEFLQLIEVDLIKVEGNQFDHLDLLHEYLAQTEDEAFWVTVEKGDSVWKIAETHQVSIDSIILLNPNLNADLIHPGQKILLEAANPLIDVKIIFENTVEEVIPYPIERIRDSSMYVDERKIIEQGEQGAKLVSYRITLMNGVPQASEILYEEVLQEPTKHVVRVGTRHVVMRVTGGVFKVATGNFSSGFGYRTHPITGRRTFHSGIDISNALGTPIYAYSSGTVTAANWSGALGNTITIDHGNGIVTRYAHLSEMFVSAGERVVGGQHIGAMGRTGYTTGVHLHFEVLKNGVHQNPLNYLY